MRGWPEGRLQRAGPVAEGVRIAWGLFFLAAAALNAFVGIPSARSVLRAFAELSWPGAEGPVRVLLLPYPTAVIGLVVVFEAIVGAMILSRETAARRGLWLAAAWLLVLVPFLGVYAIVSILLGVSILPLLARRYERSLRDVLIRREHPEALRWALIGLQAFVGTNAVFGGVALIRDGFGMPLSWLERSWFDSWTIPGILLLTVVAAPMLTAAWMTWRRWSRAGEAAIVAGGLLVGWILGQMTMVRYFFLQPALLLAGLAVGGLGFLALRSSPGRERTEARAAGRSPVPVG